MEIKNENEKQNTKEVEEENKTEVQEDLFSESIKKNFVVNFEGTVKGFHLVNKKCIDKTSWKVLNFLVLKRSGISILSDYSLGKTAKYSYTHGKKVFKISSYRLTTVCTDKNLGNIEDIHNEIEKRKNFKYYSILLREEKDGDVFYDWYLIPSDFYIFKPSTYNWKEQLGKQGKRKDTIIGWETNVINGSKMSISLSMSSQLWIDVELTAEIKQFLVCSHKNRNRSEFDYFQLNKIYEKVNNIDLDHDVEIQISSENVL